MVIGGGKGRGRKGDGDWKRERRLERGREVRKRMLIEEESREENGRK
jgi:hypothetical protein